jgi:hypothetical protein
MAKAVRGTDWSEEEASLCVETYFEYLTLELSGQSFVKSHLYRALSDKIGRTPKSIEMKFQNISAVLDVIGREWIRGLPPLANYQQMLAEKISQHIGTLDNLPITPMPQAASAGFEDMATFVWELPPTLKQIRDPKPDYIERLARQFDPVDRDMRNRDLGAAGEEFVFKQERQKLSFIGRKDLADNVRWVSK